MTGGTPARRRDPEVVEGLFRSMADRAPVILWVTDASGACTYLNARWYEFTGQTRAEAEGYGWTNAVHPDEHGRVAADFVAANAERRSYRTEYRLRRADGVYRWVIDAATPHFSETGDYLGFVGSVTDIDDRKQYEEQLLGSESRFRAAVQAMQGYLWTNDPEGRMVGEQRGWTLLTGQSEAEYSGYGWSKAVHPDDAGPTVRAWEVAVATKTPFSFEHRVCRHDGVWGHYAVRAIPVISEGRIAEWVGVHTEITEQRRAEAALHELNASLEQRVTAEVRLRSEVEAALRQSQKMEAVGILTSGIAHDFNNMLTVVVSALNILERQLGTVDPKAKRYIDAAADGAHRAAALVDRLLAYARQKPLNVADVDVNAVIGGMNTILAHAAVAVKITTDLAPGLWITRTDPGMLENVVLNLSVNARDAMPDGGVLTITTRNLVVDGRQVVVAGLQEGRYVEILFEDTGTGMSPETLEKAFNPFFTTKEIGKGTGLGLSQVYSFAQQSGGTALITSELGVGTIVRIYLAAA